jgi:hypothetical protein
LARLRLIFRVYCMFAIWRICLQIEWVLGSGYWIHYESSRFENLNDSSNSEARRDRAAIAKHFKIKISLIYDFETSMRPTAQLVESGTGLNGAKVKFFNPNPRCVCQKMLHFYTLLFSQCVQRKNKFKFRS